MGKCPHIEACAFFVGKIAGKTELIESLKQTYCLDDNTCCARWQVSRAKGAENVPLDLYPNALDRLRDLLR